jgi:hypothetical protein
MPIGPRRIGSPEDHRSPELLETCGKNSKRWDNSVRHDEPK